MVWVSLTGTKSEALVTATSIVAANCRELIDSRDEDPCTKSNTVATLSAFPVVFLFKTPT